MNADESNSEAAAALRAAAADLIARAEALEAHASAEAQPSVEATPLAPPTSDDEIKARLVVLDLSSCGRSRDEAAAVLAADFPEIDGTKLLDHFYSA